ncbi:hypothetical protein ACFX2I_035700 [Malus domestica]
MEQKERSSWRTRCLEPLVPHLSNGMLSVDGEDGELSEEETQEKKPVWVDEEEKAKQILLKLRKLGKEEEESLISGSVYMSRLRAQHAELNPGTEWAQLDRELRDGSYSEDDLLGTNEDLVVKSSAKLLSGLLEYSALKRDLRTGACIHKAVDEGCINGTSLCTSPTRTLFAGGGSDSGIVNIYSGEEFLGGKRKPIKTIENLTTKVDFLKFNGDAQIHVPSFTVFSNWPPLRRSIHYHCCLDFSPGGCFMAVGNAAGKVVLYKLHHYYHSYKEW